MERSKKPSEEQKEAILEYMELHVDFACDRFESADGASVRNDRWKELAHKLNSLGGAVKDPQKWRKYWTDQKLHVKERQALLNAANEQSGINGTKMLKPLSAFESRISALLTPASVSGNDAIREIFAATRTETPDYEEVEYLEGAIIVNESVETGEVPPTSPGAPSVSKRRRKRAPSGSSTITDFDSQILQIEREKLDLEKKSLS